MRFPDTHALARLGSIVGDVMPLAEEIDQIVSREVPGMSDSVEAMGMERQAEKVTGTMPTGNRPTQEALPEDTPPAKKMSE